MFVSSALLLDTEIWYYHNLSPFCAGFTAMFTIVTFLKVSTLWLDVALKSMSATTTKATRNKTKQKVQRGVHGLSFGVGLFVLINVVVGNMQVR